MQKVTAALCLLTPDWNLLSRDSLYTNANSETKQQHKQHAGSGFDTEFVAHKTLTIKW